MGLFGALFAGVSGLSAQSNKISIISNNISNVNTVGYKEASAAFDTLVVPSGTTNFSPGGVISNNQQLVSEQGLIQGTSSGTDLAISGNGFFAVNSSADTATGQLLYTRSGSFTQDASGNFVNSNGLYLLGWPLDSNGNIVNKTNATDPSTLSVVKIQSNASGVATPTSSVTVAANLNASQAVLLGAGETVSFNPSNPNNYQNTATSLIVGNDYGAAADSNIKRGDSFSITTGGTTTATYAYGGFSVGRNIGDGSTAGNGDSATELQTFSNQTNPISVPANVLAGAAVTVKVSAPSATGYQVGQVVNIENVAGTIGGLDASEFNGNQTITAVDTVNNTFSFSVTNNSGATTTAGTGGTGSSYANRNYPFAGNIMDAKTVSDAFLGTSTVAPFDQNALSFQIVGGVSGPQTFKYTTGSPDPSQGQFNSLSTLVTAINDTSTLNARIVSGRLYVSSNTPNESLTFINGKTTGSSYGSYGIDWTGELGLANVAAQDTTNGVNRFDSLTTLSNEVNTTPNITASLTNPLGAASINLNASDPETTIKFNDTSSNQGSILQELGFTTSTGSSITSGAASGAHGYDTGTFAIKYDPNNASKNMSGGNITPQFTRNITIYDALGISHNLALNLSKIGTNTWAAELTVNPPTDLGTGSRTDGQVAAGTITFNGDGSLASISSGLTSTIVTSWSDKASNSTISLNLGDINKTDGLSQFSAASNATSVDQNGSSAGELTGISIDSNGYVISSFSNGQTEKTFKVPLIQINNPNGLESISGDAFKETQASGTAIASDAGSNGTGSIQSSSLEQSTVDLSSQLTSLIVAQQAYGANSKLLTVADQLLQELDQIIQ